MTLDDPRREPDPARPPLEQSADIGIRADGYLVEPPLADQELRPSPDSDPRAGDPDGGDENREIKLVIRDRGRFLGIVACTLAALLFLTNLAGIVLSSTGSDEAALSIAYITIFGSILTFVGGLIAAVLDFGRVWGVAAVVLSVLANPLVLVVLLGSFTGAVN